MGTQQNNAKSPSGPYILFIRHARPLLCALLMGLPLAFGAEVQAQPNDECAAKSTPAEEISCLRAALKAKNEALAQAQGLSPQQGADTAARRSDANERSMVQAVQNRPSSPVEPVAPQPKAPAQAMATNSADTLGQEQLPGRRSRDAEAKPRSADLTAMVLAVQEDREGLFRITLENGQIWKQVERPSIQIILNRNKKYSVEISRSGFGGYRMMFPELKRAITVKRVL